MSAILQITFLSAAAVDDYFRFKYYGLFPDTGTEFTRGLSFKSSRAFPGQCTVGSDASDQAQKYVDAFTLDYLVPDFTISRVANVVIITCLNGSEIFEYEINGGATFATFEEITDDANNMIHIINMMPRQYAVPSFLHRNYLITENDLLIRTENGKKIRL